jgi:hypothetical protein
VWVRIDTGRDTRMEIEAVPGAYMCTEGASGHEVHYVDKTKCCTCGGTGDLRCEHIDAVARYLQSGGKRARALEPGEVPIACPLCGAGPRPLLAVARGRRWGAGVPYGRPSRQGRCVLRADV